MGLSIVLKFILIGWINALPAGPGAIVCLRRAVIWGRRDGMLSGLGMALADAVYVIIARAGLHRLPEYFARQRSTLLPLAGLMVIAVGLNVLKNGPRSRSLDLADRPCRGLMASGFLLGLSNPSMLISLPSLFAAMGLYTGQSDLIDVVVAVASVFGGSMAWWLIATQLIGRSRRAISGHVLKLGSALPGILLILLGIVSLFSAWL